MSKIISFRVTEEEFQKIDEAAVRNEKRRADYVKAVFLPTFLTGNTLGTEKFWSYVQIAGPDECWEWRGANGKKPFRYGSVRFRGEVTCPHRVAYALANGGPAKNHVLHTCDNPPCCNPAHLYDGTHQQNMADCVERKRHASFRQKKGVDNSTCIQ